LLEVLRVDRALLLAAHVGDLLVELAEVRRRGHRVDFPSYRPGELTAIGAALAGRDGDGWDEDAAEELASICTHVVREGWIDELGNGRFIRTLYEKSCAYRDLRLSLLREPPGREDLATLRLPDLVQAYGELIDGRG
ncbi:hypothetical protein ABZ885_24285, partial [Kitasatospora sp. NPDC047058]